MRWVGYWLRGQDDRLTVRQRDLITITIAIFVLAVLGILAYDTGYTAGKRSTPTVTTIVHEPVFPTCSSKYTGICWEGVQQDERLRVDCNSARVRCDDADA